MYSHKNGLTLQKLERKYLPRLLSLKNESWFGTHHIAIISSDDQTKWFESLNSNRSLVFTAHITKGREFPFPGGGFLREDRDEPIGLYKIDNIDWLSRSYECGHDVFVDSRDLGYGNLVVEAGVDFGFEILNMHRIDTQVLRNNIASQKTLEYAGFVYEGVRRKAVHKCGTYHDSCCMGILREDWTNLPRVVGYGGVCNLTYQPKDMRP